MTTVYREATEAKAASPLVRPVKKKPEPPGGVRTPTPTPTRARISTHEDSGTSPSLCLSQPPAGSSRTPLPKDPGSHHPKPFLGRAESSFRCPPEHSTHSASLLPLDSRTPGMPAIVRTTSEQDQKSPLGFVSFQGQPQTDPLPLLSIHCNCEGAGFKNLPFLTLDPSLSAITLN